MRERDDWDHRDRRRNIASALAVGILAFSGASIYLAYDIHEHGTLSERLIDEVKATGENIKSGIHELAVEIANATE